MIARKGASCSRSVACKQSADAEAGRQRKTQDERRYRETKANDLLQTCGGGAAVRAGLAVPARRPRPARPATIPALDKHCGWLSQHRRVSRHHRTGGWCACHAGHRGPKLGRRCARSRHGRGPANRYPGCWGHPLVRVSPDRPTEVRSARRLWLSRAVQRMASTAAALALWSTTRGSRPGTNQGPINQQVAAFVTS
jgi:hypothetical protein